MKSTIEHYLEFDEILLPEKYLTIPIPSWEAVVEPVLQGVLESYLRTHPQDKNQTQVTDAMVADLNYPGLSSVNDLKTFAMEAFSQREKERKFQEEIFPALLVFFGHTSQTIINQEELAAYRQILIQNYRDDAEREGLSYEEFIRLSFGVDAKDTQSLYEQLDEYFTYKLIANARHGQDHQAVTEEDYDEYIQSQVIHQGEDEIDLRARMPFHYYRDLYPEMMLTEELKTYFKDQIKIIIQEA